MALHQANEKFTKWVHTENGNVMVRRIHRLEVQARDGRLHILTADKLPDFIQTSAGHGMKGCHLAQILLSPNPAPEYVPDKSKTWGLSHFVSFCIGFLLLVMVRFIHGLFAECL